MKYKDGHCRANLLRLCCILICLPSTGFGDSHHSLSVEWERSNETLTGSNQSTDIRPESVNLHFTYGLSDSWGIAGMVSRGNANKSRNEQLFLDKDLEGASASVSYQQEDWWLEAGAYYGQTDTRLRTAVQGEIYSEQVETLDIFLNYSYELDWANWWITPGLGFGYQENNIETEQTFTFRDDLLLSQTQLQHFDGAYFSSSLSASYPFPASETSLILPSLLVGWTEPIAGDVLTSTLLQETGSGSSRQSLTNSNEKDDSDGSGYFSFSVAVLIDAYSVDLGVIEPLSEDQLGTRASFQLGLSF